MTLILITGSIDDVEDPFQRLKLSELYYEFWDKDESGENLLTIRREPVPIRYYGRDTFRIVQDLGSGKTLLAMDILSEIKFHGGTVAANLGLVWDNEGKPKNEWEATILTLDDLRNLKNCTVLIDDIQNTILRWNVAEALIVQEIAAAARKQSLTIIITAQREKQIPPAIRDMASEWRVPIIRVRDNTKETPDNQTGYPMEMINLIFGGSKVFRFISDPIINLESLFKTYTTTDRSISLKDVDSEGARINQPGYKLEVEALEFLKIAYPEEEWAHLNGKRRYDIQSKNYGIDVTGTSEDGHLYVEHKDFLGLMKTARSKGIKGSIMFKYAERWKFVSITYHLNDLVNEKRIKVELLKNLMRDSLTAPKQETPAV